MPYFRTIIDNMRYILDVLQETKIVDLNGANVRSSNLRVLANEKPVRFGWSSSPMVSSL
jgi:hypothetical protein